MIEAGQVEERLEEQRRLYGEPIGVLVRRVMAVLGLTQSRVAGVLGLSPAMLSQVMSGQRVKIANPLAVARLQTLLTLAEDAPHLTRDAVAQRLEEIRDSQQVLSTGQHSASSSECVDLVRRLLRAVASGQELDRAARMLDETSPQLAEVLRVYGTGTSADAARHLDSVSHLL